MRYNTIFFVLLATCFFASIPQISSAQSKDELDQLLQEIEAESPPQATAPDADAAISNAEPQQDDAYSPQQRRAPIAQEAAAPQVQPFVPQPTPLAEQVPAEEIGAEAVDATTPALPDASSTLPASQSQAAEATTTPENIDSKTATLQVLDKLDAKVSEIDVKVSNQQSFKDLKIEVRRCVRSSQAEKNENMAYMRIWDLRKQDYKNLVFQGWMFSSNPALNPFENPIYDVVLLKCLD